MNGDFSLRSGILHFIAGDTLSNNSYVLPESGPGAKLSWHPKKAAFIAGLLESSSGNIRNWDKDSIGFGAINLDYANKVKGEHSFAAGIGDYIGSGGFGAAAIGNSNLADSNECVPIGFGNEAHAKQAVAIGTGAEAWGRSSLATGYMSKSLGYFNTAGGYFSTAKGEYSFSNGYKNYSGAPYSFTVRIQDSVLEFTSPVGGTGSASAFGRGIKVKGGFSLTAGSFNVVDSAAYNSLVVGFANTSDGNKNVVLGSSNIVNSRYSLAIGNNNSTGFPKYYQSGYNFSDAFIIGRGNDVNKKAMAIGFNYLILDGGSSIVIGKNNFCGNLGSNNLILGHNSCGNGNYSTAIGYRFYSKASLQQQIENGQQFNIAFEKEHPVAFASYSLTDDSNEVYKLHKIYILHSQQGRGIGKFLISFIKQDIAPATTLQLNVNRHNKAIDFYQKKLAL